MKPRQFALRALRGARGLSVGARLLGLELCLRADDAGNGTDTVRTLAGDLEVTERCVERWLRDLGDGGHFERVDRGSWRVATPTVRSGSPRPYDRDHPDRTIGITPTAESGSEPPTPTVRSGSVRLAPAVSENQIPLKTSGSGSDPIQSDLLTGEVRGSGGKGKTENENPKTKSDLEAVREVFAHWQSALSHPTAKLVRQREAKIRARLREGYSVAELKAAIDGVKRSPWHMGENPDGRVYDDIVTVLRDGGQVEKFGALASGQAGVNARSQGREGQVSTGAFRASVERIGR